MGKSGIGLPEAPRDFFQIAGIEGDGNGKAGQFMDGCGRRIALGNDQKARLMRITDQMVPTANAATARKRLAPIGIDALRRDQPSADVIDRQDEIAPGAPRLRRWRSALDCEWSADIKQEAMSIDALALQIRMIAPGKGQPGEEFVQQAAGLGVDRLARLFTPAPLGGQEPVEPDAVLRRQWLARRSLPIALLAGLEILNKSGRPMIEMTDIGAALGASLVAVNADAVEAAVHLRWAIEDEARLAEGGGKLCDRIAGDGARPAGKERSRQMRGRIPAPGYSVPAGAKASRLLPLFEGDGEVKPPRPLRGFRFGVISHWLSQMGLLSRVQRRLPWAREPFRCW